MTVRSLGNIPRSLILGFVYLIITFFYIFSSPAFSFAAWTPQAIPTTNTLYAVYFVDANVGYAVGASGTVIKTIDGGNNWTTAASAGGSNLRAVYFINATTGWAVGDTGIYRTTDGAASWPLNTYASQFDIVVFTPDGSTGFAGNQNGRIYWTNDGGASWPLHPATFSGNPIITIEFVDNNNGFLVTESGEVYATVDGGVNWAARVDVPNQLSNVRDSSWVDPLHGWVISGGARELAYTTDGGNSWTLGPNVVSFDYNAVHFTTTLNGYLVDDSGNIRHTTDGGLTWLIVGNAGGELFDIFIAPGGEIYTVGDPDAIYTETPLSLDIVKQAWLVGGIAPLTSPTTAPTGSTVVFLIYVRNPTASQVDDIRILDNLDDTAFDYVEGSLWFGGLANAAATDLQIFTATEPGTGINVSDAQGVGLASACDVSEATCPGTSADRISVGAVGAPPNSQVNIGTNSVFGIRFEVIIK
jgi:photosystem II stability/assembly factor-like uncharacterized protein